MNGTQYEEFCRLFLVDKLGIPVETIESRRIPSATHPDLPKYYNQIDLYWEDQKDLTLYKNFADAKWRGGSRKISIDKIRELQQVKEEIDAHKAMMITNIGFTRDAKKFAENHGIALHIVRPNFDYTILHRKNRETIQSQLQEHFTGGKPAYTHEVVHRAFDLGIEASTQSPVSAKVSTYSKKVVSTASNRMTQTTANRRTSSGTQKAQGGNSRTRTGGQSSSRQKGSGPPRGGSGRSNRGR